jgi:hypothetical protein
VVCKVWGLCCRRDLVTGGRGFSGRTTKHDCLLFCCTSRKTPVRKGRERAELPGQQVDPCDRNDVRTITVSHRRSKPMRISVSTVGSFTGRNYSFPFRRSMVAVMTSAVLSCTARPSTITSIPHHPQQQQPRDSTTHDSP